MALAPDVVLAGASEATAALREATRTVPIVFVGVTDPVGAGYVASLARPGGNATGLAYVEFEAGRMRRRVRVGWLRLARWTLMVAATLYTERP